MGAYNVTLPQVFQYCAELPSETVSAMVTKLLSRRGDAPNGSSFAVTVDAKQGHQKLWLSRVSYNYLMSETGCFALEAQ
jgi:hypothetical protein